MALKPAQHYISEAEYLAGEMISDIKHELIDGEVYAMAGASRNHQRLAGNVFTTFAQHLRGTPCETFMADIKVKAEHNFFYPDVMVVCADENGDEYYTEKPTIIVEVLSKATRRMDKSTKLAAYKALPSLQEYVLIEQDFVDVEILRRSTHWLSEHYFLGDSLTLESIDLTVTVSDLYQRVNNEDMQEFLQQQQAQASDVEQR
ncbi:Uma2 family endonuclease [Methylomonas sp. ZR1]|uniref:Uma2 family endonuclease n=1 Tax=Methylomonas sp. ZR1 TaxID=1797072 RepID=UPI0014911000|nr:Uma2 family endonuclease [Methylomonas sp. ZR1]NOV28227.1 Uma2 family endonuclease [Methylomonas sp. ZR1]